MFNSKNKIVFNAIELIATIILIASFAVSMIIIPLWDFDFWWHIATGRFIVSTVSLPDKDPFSYPLALNENKNKFPERENFILKQYWLGQVIFYLIYDYAGPKGIILLRTLLLTMTLVFVFWRLQKWSVSFPVSFVFVFILSNSLLRATGERPVLFTILFTALTFFIMEDFRYKIDKKIFLLPPLMLFWANLHGGFIIGVVIITIFMIVEGIKIILKKTTHTRHDIILFYASTIIALGFSFVNPAGWDAFAISFSSKYKPFLEGIQEYQPPFLLYINKVYPIHYEYVSLIALSLLVLVLRNKRLALTHIILLSGLLVMSISARRFMVYFIIIGVMIVGRELDILITGLLKRRFSEVRYKRILNGLTAVSLLSVILYFISIYNADSFRFEVASGYSVPVRAVDFIEKNNLSGKMFNDYGYGGYIIWRLYPPKKTFIDSRALNIAVMSEYKWILTTTYVDAYSNNKGKASPTKFPLWEKLLKHYDINFIVLSVTDMFSNVYPLIFRLTESNEWAPVYSDNMSVIFVKNTRQNRSVIEKNQISKEDVYNTVIFHSASRALSNKVNPRALISLGDTFYTMGRMKDALIAYRYALNRMPENLMIQGKINSVEAEIKRDKKIMEQKQTKKII